MAKVPKRPWTPGCLTGFAVLAGCSPAAGTGLSLPAGYDVRTAREEPASLGNRPLGQRFVLDPVCGIRPRRGGGYELPAQSLATATRSTIRIGHDAWGFTNAVRAIPVEPDPAQRPRILVVGDDHLDGTVAPQDHAVSLVAARVRAAPRFARAEVANASCAGYGLAQLLLRTRATAETFVPDVVVVAVALGDDLLQLIDERLPTIGDDGGLRPADTEASPIAQTESVRRQLRIPRRDVGLVARGLAQASALGDKALREQIQGRARAVLDHFVRLATRQGFDLVFVTIPSFELTFPDEVAKLPGAAQLLANQRSAAAWLHQQLEQRGITTVQLREEFVWVGPIDLYTADFRLYTSGHRRLAARVLPTLRDVLDAQPSRD